MGVSIFRSAVLLACSAAWSGCATYRAEPFDQDAFSQAWRSRARDDAPIGRNHEPARISTTAPSTPAPFSIEDGLTLAEGQAIALLYNPTLRVARLKAGVTRATADNAGLWADPTLGVDAERIISSVDDPWVVGATLNLTLPISGRLEAEKRRAKAEHFAELIRVAGQEWALRHRLKVAWADWSTQAKRVELLEELASRLEAINRLTDRLADAGSLSRIEARLFRIERATRQSELSAAAARLAELRMELHSTLGLVPDAAVAFSSETAFAHTPVDAQGLAANNFEIRIAAAEYEAAERTLQHEVRAQYPDLVIGPGFGSDEGDERVLLGVSLPLSLWNRNRQGVAEAIAGRDLARVELETTIELQTSALAIAQARLDGATRQREVFESIIAPATDEQAVEANRLAELGEVNAILLLDAFVRQYEARLGLLEARLAEVKASSRLAELAGDAPSAIDLSNVKATKHRGPR